MKKLVLTIILVISTTILSAQKNSDSTKTRPINNININLLGDASLISLNYERLFFIRPIFMLTGKLGLGYNEEFQVCIWGPCTTPNKYLTIPLHITGNVGKGRHFFEFGIGGTRIIGHTNQPYYIYPLIGYRLNPLKKNRVNFRIVGQIPFSGVLYTDDILFVPVGFSLGFCF